MDCGASADVDEFIVIVGLGFVVGILLERCPVLCALERMLALARSSTSEGQVCRQDFAAATTDDYPGSDLRTMRYKGRSSAAQVMSTILHRAQY